MGELLFLHSNGNYERYDCSNGIPAYYEPSGIDPEYPRGPIDDSRYVLCGVCALVLAAAIALAVHWVGGVIG